MENSNIEWTDHTFNPWIGCTKVDELCAHCYAETRDKRFNGGIHWGKGAPRQRTSASNWNEVRKWNRNCTVDLMEGPRRPRVFCASLSDWLDDEVPIEWLVELLHLIYECKNLDILLLTKRPENFFPRLTEASKWFVEVSCVNMRTEENKLFWFWLEDWVNYKKPPANVWMGTSVGTQKSADKRIPEMLKIPARVRFLSCEPLLGPIDLWSAKYRNADGSFTGAVTRWEKCGVDWVIAGGESGAGARPMHPDWARSLRDQCAAAGVAFFFKQWGEWAPAENHGETVSVTVAQPGGAQNPQWHEFTLTQFKPRQLMARVGKKAAGRVLDGVKHGAFPV